MGLDVMGYRGIKHVDEVTDDTVFLYPNPAFPGRNGSIKEGDYEYQDCEPGLSLSYGGYSIWRDELAVLAGYKSARHCWRKKEGPFWELIKFSDCEGVIGHEHCKKLVKDFEAFQAEANSKSKWFLDRYNSMYKAFLCGSNIDGCVRFG